MESIPITNQVRLDETIDDLNKLCDRYGYGHRINNEDFEVVTPVGKWKIHTDVRPVTMEHINLLKNPGCEVYHDQHRIFLSMIDALEYIYKHDSKILCIDKAASNNKMTVMTEG